MAVSLPAATASYSSANTGSTALRNLCRQSGASLGRCAAIGVHPVHAVFADQTNEALSQLFHCFVEGFAGSVTVFAQFIVLCLHHSGQCSHEHAAFTGEVAVNFHLKSCGKQESGTDGNTQRQGSFHGPAGGILVNGDTRC